MATPRGWFNHFDRNCLCKLEMQNIILRSRNKKQGAEFARNGEDGMLGTVSIGYIIIAATFFSATLREGSENRLPWRTARTVGLFLCLIWPALIIFVAATELISATSRNRSANLERKPKTKAHEIA
jgi:small-conductance mechanosensitive channel